MKATELREIMQLAWQFVKRNGCTISEALKVAWSNFKLRSMMSLSIVKFYYQKVDGSRREAFGTLSNKLIPAIESENTRAKNDTVQTYYDTEVQGWRCFKKLNLIF